MSLNIDLMMLHVWGTKLVSYSDLAVLKKLDPTELSCTKGIKDKAPAALYSLAARLNLNFTNQDLLLQAVTHKNFYEDDSLTNEGLQFTDEELFLQDKDIPSKKKFGGKSKEPVQRITQGTAISHALKAIVGALYMDKGPHSARQFIHDHILSRDVNMQDAIEIKEPKRELLKSETGRLSYAPAFVVGVYSDTEQLGEGFGSSIKMAEFRYYLKEARDFTLPSIVDSHEKQATYIPTKVGDTPPRL
ncbi:8695_t:CDS:2 [Racocetra fulgida]|uniref:8695_t:CDS:1 n=1 Tax=Racocetra fulgida TaxID=60492 RepID=A0A9N9G395_9GLOM|nr:8695_t:CDS:2 [Racocetra fulgida]